MAKLLFHNRCGNMAEVTNGQQTAHRLNANNEYTNGGVLTSRTLMDGELFEVKVDEMVNCWTGSLHIGVTTHDPFTLAFPSMMTDLTSGMWMVTSEGLISSGTIISEDIGEILDDIHLDDTIGVIWKSDETVHLIINGVGQGEAANNVPAGVYGVVDLIAQTSKVTIVDHSGTSYATPSLPKTNFASSMTKIKPKSYSEVPIKLSPHWKIVKSLEDETAFHRAVVDTHIAEAIKALVELTWDYGHVGQGKDARNLTHSCIEVTKVEQIENTHMYKEYERQRKAFCERAARNSFPKVTRYQGEDDVITSMQNIISLDQQLIPEINEYFLFHGAKMEYSEAICRQGIDFRLGNAGMFGKGAYFCEMSTKADQYTDTKDDRGRGEHVMILAKVILGQSYIAKQACNNMVRPPCVHNCSSNCQHPKSEFYNSVMGTHAHANRRLLFREFIIYEEKQCYPSYLITYVRK